MGAPSRKLRQMWDVVGQGTGMEWDVEVEIRPWAECGYSDSRVGYLGRAPSFGQHLMRELAKSLSRHTVPFSAVPPPGPMILNSQDAAA